MACEQAGRGRCAPSPAPLFPVGYVVKVDKYVGVVPLDHPHPAPLRQVKGVRLVAVDEHDDMQDPIWTYPNGWEYHLVGVLSGNVWGWVPEAEILDAGYEPPPPMPPGTEVVTLPHPDTLVTVAGVDGVPQAVPAADAPEL